MKYLKTIVISMLSISSFSSSAQDFKINGTSIGIKDSTWLYLRTSSPEKLIDSAMVMNGKFSLTGKTDEKITNVILYTAKYTNYVMFWLEHKNISINIKNGEFKKAIIKGSATQDENAVLSKLKGTNGNRQDSLSKLLSVTTGINEKKELQEKIKNLRNEEQQLDINFVKNHPNSLIAANLLNVYATTWGKEKTKELYQNFSQEIKNTGYGKNISDFIALNRNIKIGGNYVDFEQLNANGEKIKLSGIKGKYILLEFWASWCGPCREENPNLVKTYNLFKDKGFSILGVSADDNRTNWLGAIKEDQLPWENVSDLKGDKNEVALIYGINAFPTNFLIDDKGIIIAKNLRGDELRKKLEELLP